MPHPNLLGILIGDVNMPVRIEFGPYVESCCIIDGLVQFSK